MLGPPHSRGRSLSNPTWGTPASAWGQPSTWSTQAQAPSGWGAPQRSGGISGGGGGWNLSSSAPAASGWGAPSAGTGGGAPSLLTRQTGSLANRQRILTPAPGANRPKLSFGGRPLGSGASSGGGAPPALGSRLLSHSASAPKLSLSSAPARGRPTTPPSKLGWRSPQLPPTPPRSTSLPRVNAPPALQRGGSLRTQANSQRPAPPPAPAPKGQLPPQPALMRWNKTPPPPAPAPAAPLKSILRNRSPSPAPVKAPTPPPLRRASPPILRPVPVRGWQSPPPRGASPGGGLAQRQRSPSPGAGMGLLGRGLRAPEGSMSDTGLIIAGQPRLRIDDDCILICNSLIHAMQAHGTHQGVLRKKQPTHSNLGHPTISAQCDALVTLLPPLWMLLRAMQQVAIYGEQLSEALLNNNVPKAQEMWKQMAAEMKAVEMHARCTLTWTEAARKVFAAERAALGRTTDVDRTCDRLELAIKHANGVLKGLQDEKNKKYDPYLYQAGRTSDLRKRNTSFQSFSRSLQSAVGDFIKLVPKWVDWCRMTISVGPERYQQYWATLNHYGFDGGDLKFKPDYCQLHPAEKDPALINRVHSPRRGVNRSASPGLNGARRSSSPGWR